MARKKFSEKQIFEFLQEAESGVSVKDLTRKHGFHEITFYNWRTKYKGMTLADIEKMKELERENSRLKQLVADLALENHAINEILKKKY